MRGVAWVRENVRGVQKVQVREDVQEVQVREDAQETWIRGCAWGFISRQHQHKGPGQGAQM